MDTTRMASGTPSAPTSHTYSAALVLVGCLIPLPIVATLVTAAIYITPISPALVTMAPSWAAPSWVVCLAGLVITLLYWLLFALPFTGFSSVDSAIPVIGGDLKNRYLMVRATFNALLAMETDTSASKEYAYGYRIASEQVKSFLSELETLLSCKDMRWIAGTGYLYAWSLMHRAEEAIISLEPSEEVIRDALYDESCLEGSNIQASEASLNKLRRAVANLSPSAAVYLDAQPVNASIQNSNAIGGVSSVPATVQVALTPDKTPQATGSNGTAAGGTTQELAGDNGPAPAENASQGGSADPSLQTAQKAPTGLAVEPGNNTDSQTHDTTDKPVVDMTAELEARSALRDVRRTINEYRYGLWEGLVTIRNQLMGAALITGLATYVLLGLAIIAGAPQASILAATIFYSVGALVGLFGRLYSESQADQSNEDYDLTLARIIVTPLLAGLAAVGGVLLTTMLSLTLLKSPTAQATNPQIQLGASFNLGSNTLGIVIAAVFGLTPNLFINALQSKAKTITDQLQSSSASNQ